MIKVGLTGGIGSGKSVVARIFTILGVPVFNSDIQASVIILTNAEVKEQLITSFGKNVYKNNQLNKPLLRELIFSNDENRKLVNEIVHPQVRKSFKLFCEQHTNNPYIIQEAAILFESGAYKLQDKNITVFADMALRIKRIVERDGLTKQQVEQIISKQLTEEEKIKLSDSVITNNGTELVTDQVMTIHRALIA